MMARCFGLLAALSLLGGCGSGARTPLERCEAICAKYNTCFQMNADCAAECSGGGGNPGPASCRNPEAFTNCFTAASCDDVVSGKAESSCESAC